MRDRNRTETVKVQGPWGIMGQRFGVQTTKEISLEEWTSYTPLNKRVRGKWFRVVK